MLDRTYTDTVLLVDDDAAIRELLAVRLRHLGHEVLTARNVSEAIPLLENAHVDAVLSDHSMPGATGIELLAYVNTRMPAIPFVLMSADVTPEMKEAAWSGGAADVVAKGDLLHQLRTLFSPSHLRLHAAA
jgi:DNA-binding NtrC family response regulator